MSGICTVYCASGVHYLNPTFWFSDWQYHFQSEWMYYLQFPRLIITQKSKFIDIYYCFPWWKWEWKHRWQLFELLRGENPIICRLPIQNKFWSILLMMWLRCFRIFQSSISGKWSGKKTNFFLLKNAGGGGGAGGGGEKKTRAPKYSVEKVYFITFFLS